MALGTVDPARLYADLKDRAEHVMVLPDGLAPDRIMIAVYVESGAPYQVSHLETEDFTWLTGGPNTKLSTINKAITRQLLEGEYPAYHDGETVQFHLYHGAFLLSGDELLRPASAWRENESSKMVCFSIAPTAPSSSSRIPLVERRVNACAVSSQQIKPDPDNDQARIFANLPRPSSSHTRVKREQIKPEADDFQIPPRLDSYEPGPAPRAFDPNAQIQEMFKDADVETMEKGVKKGLELLDRLKKSLGDGHGSQEAVAWLAQIEKIRKQAEYQPTIVGVVGNTGAGKSSVINALLNEERLVPTNCMRACTAVVTEISYNRETEDPYHAKIEFITAADWAKELRALFQDLLNETGQIKRQLGEEGEVAWAKIKGVYPKKTKEEIAHAGVEGLLRDNVVSTILGNTRTIDEKDALRFYKRLQKYVDSKEKSTGRDKDKNKGPKEMEYWPLIKVVKLFVKSPVLETGAVIVDLPGVHDANAARAAVADNYMKKCTGLWVVAPITRAVDDKSAHKLLGEGFRRQLLMDGGFNSISFICSKSDDISVSEAMLSLHLDEDLEEESEEIDRLENELKEKQIRKKYLEQTRCDMQEAADALDDKIQAYEDLQEKAEAGETVYEPKDTEKKRKRSRSESPVRGRKAKKTKKSKAKKSVIADSDDDFIVDDNEEDASGSDSNSDDESVISVKSGADEETEDRCEPLTLEVLKAKLEELKSTKKEARQEKLKFTRTILELKDEISAVKDRIKKLNNKRATVCIEARNEYSSAAIQQDFAAGLAELDREAAEERDGENFNPDVELRDYEEVAKSLPVFCVSSRGYQKLKGRLKKDGDPPVFQNVEQTGMPRLQQHCTKLTEKGRLANGRKFLTSVSQLANSLTLWSSDDPNVKALSETDKQREIRHLDQKFVELNDKLDRTIQKTVIGMKEELSDSIFDRYDDAIKAAENNALATSDKWGEKVNRENPPEGGLYWSTYKAVVRRNGAYTNSTRGLIDFNSQLSDPIVKTIAGQWERCFTRRIPQVLKSYAAESKAAILTFHESIETRAGPARAAQMALLAGQLQTYGDALTGLSTDVENGITETQREINREFMPAIQDAMKAVYEWCAAEAGPGQFMRMKAMMRQHIEQKKSKMFRDSCMSIKDKILKLVKSVETQLEDATSTIFHTLSRDYHSIFGGNAQAFSAGGRAAEKKVYKKVYKRLEGWQEPFQRVVNGLPDLPVKEEEDESEDEAPRPKREAGPMKLEGEEEHSDDEEYSDDEDHSSEEEDYYDVH